MRTSHGGMWLTTCRSPSHSNNNNMFSCGRTLLFLFFLIKFPCAKKNLAKHLSFVFIQRNSKGRIPSSQVPLRFRRFAVAPRRRPELPHGPFLRGHSLPKNACHSIIIYSQETAIIANILKVIRICVAPCKKKNHHILFKLKSS